MGTAAVRRECGGVRVGGRVRARHWWSGLKVEMGVGISIGSRSARRGVWAMNQDLEFGAVDANEAQVAGGRCRWSIGKAYMFWSARKRDGSM